MYRRFHDRFGTAGVVIAIVALVATLGGTALAASGALTGKQKKEVEKIAKKFAGKNGAPGAPGTPGANGKDGTNGTNGTNGAPGEQGDTGNTGANGKSVKLTAEPAGTNCPVVGGTKVEVEGNAASKQYVCNGQEGSPWTAGGTLPPGETETGTWVLSASGTGEFTTAIAPISFPIRLPEAGAAVRLNKAETESSAGTGGCTGTVVAPTAPEGKLCIYTSVENSAEYKNPSVGSVTGVANTYGPSGTLVFSETELGGDSALIEVTGSWAVTAPSP